MRIRKKRYLFITFDLLQQVKFGKLLDVSDRIYVLVDADTRTVPIKLARKMQQVGRTVRWVKVGHAGNGVLLPLGFLLGSLHEKTDHDIEFAILTDDDRYDPLVQMINDQGRRALRVLPKRSAAEGEPAQLSERIYQPRELADVPYHADPVDYATDSFLDEEFSENASHGNGHQSENGSAATTDATLVTGEQTVEEVTRRTIERLVRSGNRPAEIETLRHYIMFSTHEVVDDERVDQVIEQMQASEQIELADSQVSYRF